ncbi:MAG: hypothetical protein P0120_04700 [Nitrospira sp.]|nr:hypothetical protein [Nitrospira sp.]
MEGVQREAFVRGDVAQTLFDEAGPLPSRKGSDPSHFEQNSAIQRYGGHREQLRRGGGRRDRSLFGRVRPVHYRADEQQHEDAEAEEAATDGGTRTEP